MKLQADLDNSDAKIDIGVIVLKDGVLTMKRGSTLPVTVPQTIGPDDLLEKAVEKHSCYNKDVIRSTDKAFYRLLYPDKSVVHTLPGSNQPFTLQRYKNDIGKPYSKLTLFLCTSADYHDSLYYDFDSSSDNDELSDATPGAGFVPLQKKPKSSQRVQHKRQSYLSLPSSSSVLLCADQGDGSVQTQSLASASVQGMNRVVTDTNTPGAPLTYFNDRGVLVIFLGLKFWPKVIFFGSMKDAKIFLGRKKNRGILFGLRKKD